MPEPEYSLVWDNTRNDYYLGRWATMFWGDAVVWSGYSYDAIGDILVALGVQAKVLVENA